MVSVKEVAAKDVISALGPLQEMAAGLIGPVESIIGQAVEKFVHRAKNTAA